MSRDNKSAISYKHKEKLYEQFLKKRNSVRKEKQKPFTCLFESVTQKSKKNYHRNLLITYGNDMNRICPTIKEIIGSKKSRGTLFPKRLVLKLP